MAVFMKPADHELQIFLTDDERALFSSAMVAPLRQLAMARRSLFMVHAALLGNESRATDRGFWEAAGHVRSWLAHDAPPAVIDLVIVRRQAGPLIDGARCLKQGPLQADGMRHHCRFPLNHDGTPVGSVSHFAIIVTSFVEEDLAKAHAALKAIAAARCVERYGDDYSEMDVTPIFASHVEGYASFMVLPTGSKYDGPECRQPFVDKIRELVEGDQSVHDDYTKGPVDDGGLCLDWVFVAYGVDHGKAKVIADCMEDDR